MIHLHAEVRHNQRKSMVKELRNQGKIPAVMYGKTVEDTPIYVDEADLSKLIREKGRSAIVKLQINGTQQPVVIGDIQRDPVRQQILHVDFKEINMQEELTTEVDVHFLGEEKVTNKGAVLQKQLHQLPITCLPDSLPSTVEVDVSTMDVGDTLTVSDLVPKAGVSVALDDDAVIATVVQSTQEAHTEETISAEGVVSEAVEG